MRLREQDRHFLWSLAAAIGVILVWKGLWEGLYYIPYFGDPWVALFIGFAMLIFSGIMFQEFDPLGGIEKTTSQILKAISNKNNRDEYKIIFRDRVKKKDVVLSGSRIIGVEKKSIVFKHPKDNREIFIPIHRIKEILLNGKTKWRL